MTITVINDSGATGEKTSDTSITLTVTNTINAGNNAIVVGAFDNVDTADGFTQLVTSVTDSGGNEYVKAGEWTNGQSAAAAGATCSVWYSPNPAAGLTSGVGTITMTLGSAVTAKAMSVVEVVCTDGTLYLMPQSVTSGLFGSLVKGLSNDAADPGSIDFGRKTGLSDPANYLHLRAIATEEEDATALTVTNAFWTAINEGTSGTGGVPTSNMQSRGEYIITTSHTNTSDPTLFSADHASIACTFVDTPFSSTGRLSALGCG